jgi:hypothetical protein
MKYSHGMALKRRKKIEATIIRHGIELMMIMLVMQKMEQVVMDRD